MPTFEYVKALIEADKDVPYRTCTICNTLILITRRQFLPHIISCKCRESGEPALIRLTWPELKTLLGV